MKLNPRNNPPRASAVDDALHAADAQGLELRILELALERTGTRNGALFLWDPARKGLALGFHVVEGLVVDVGGALLQPRHDGRPNGIALHVMDTGASYLTNDTARDPHYAPYFLPVRSIAAVPVVYQRRPIGVLTVSARETGAFGPAHVAELEALAASAAKFLRRAQLHRAESAAHGRPFLIKGLSPAWIEVERRIEQVAQTDAPVLVQGESGTGKELVAHAIHFNSRRSGGPFVVVNCAAIPETLLESVLFGHVRGAFTGAAADKVGELRKAHGGTLFLDELGELTMTLQPKLLRAVEYGEVQPLGSNRAPERVDVRVVCATHRDLPAMVRERRFRDDLYYRLAVMRIELPPLRAYKDNLEVLAHVFLQQAAERHGRPVTRLQPEAFALLRAYDFPGNVRELRNALEHAVILAEGDEVRAQDLPETMTRGAASASASVAASGSGSGSAWAVTAPSGGGGVPTTTTGATPVARRPTLREMREAWLAPLEAAWLRGLLAESGGSVRRAATAAGVDAVTMYRLLRRRGVAAGRAGAGSGAEPGAGPGGGH
jgi:transcriptional regulator with GAF, ATPase, and Fis domain